MAKGLPSNPSILVIHTAFLGDIVLATSFLRELRKCYPDSRIYFLTTPQGMELLAHNPWKVEVIPFHKRGQDSGPLGWWATLKKIRALRPSLVFCLHRSLRSVLLAKFSGAESWGFLEAAASFLLSHTVARKEGHFEAEKNLALLERKTGRKDFSPFPELFFLESQQDQVRQKFQLPERYIVIAPSSVWNTKRWIPASFGALADRLATTHSCAVVMVGGGSSIDLETAREVRESYFSMAKNRESLMDLTGKTTLEEMKVVLKGASIVISNDSSPLHMAIAMGTKVVGIFGPTTKSLGFFPLAPEGMAAVVEKIDLSCRPCGKHGHHQCPLTHFKCMRDLSVADVMNQVSKLCR